MLEIIAKVALFKFGFICGAGFILFLRKKSIASSHMGDNNDQ